MAMQFLFSPRLRRLIPADSGPFERRRTRLAC